VLNWLACFQKASRNATGATLVARTHIHCRPKPSRALYLLTWRDLSPGQTSGGLQRARVALEPTVFGGLDWRR